MSRPQDEIHNALRDLHREVARAHDKAFRMSRPPYEIVEARNVSTGVAKRVNVSLIVPPGADLEATVRDVAKAVQRERWDVAFVFVYGSRADVGTAAVLARGRWVRKGAKGVPAVPWVGAVRSLTEPGRKGTLEIAIER